MASGIKRKLGQPKPNIKKVKQARLPTPPTPPASDYSDNEIEDDDEVLISNGGGIVDPMIDIQPSDTDDGEDEGNNEVNSEAMGEESDSDPGPEEQVLLPSSNEAGPSRKRSLYAPPTLKEMETLQATTDSSVPSSTTSFNLQLSALLQSTLLSQTQHPALKSLLIELHSTINSLPKLQPVVPKTIKRKLDIPSVSPDEFSAFRNDVKWTFGWDKPSEVFVGGSWSVVGGWKKGKGEMGGVDMVVVMPQGLFSPKDRLDYRYFHKRAYYLTVIKNALTRFATQKGPIEGCRIAWEFAGGDARRPVIALTAGKEQGLKHRLTIRIHAAAPPDTFTPVSISPNRSSLRHDTLSENRSTLYNSSLMHDTLHKSNLLHLHRLSQLLPDRTVDSFLALWRIWCRRRGISRDRGGSGWFASMVLGWVIGGGDIGVEGNRGKFRKSRGLGKGLGYWPALRAAWEFLAQTDFSRTPVLMACDEASIPSSDHLEASEAVFVESTGSLNILTGWDKGDIQLLQHHARETLAFLEDSAIDSFAEVFLKDRKAGVDVVDELIRVDITNVQVKLKENLHNRSEHSNFSERLASNIAAILRKGLTDRVQIVHVGIEDNTNLSIGLIFNPSNATRVLDVGPASDQTELCKAFNEFWGEKADLRRFKDGSIAESVVWDITRPEDAAMIPGRIVTYLLNRHFTIDESSITRCSSEVGWSKILQIPDSARESISTINSQKLGFRPILDGYQEFYKFLKSIDEELPLSILNVSPISELLRYSSTFIPHPIDLGRLPSASECVKYIPRAELLLQFESSPKWPEDLAAIQHVKMAILEKLAGLINSQLKDAQAGIVVDGHHSDIEDHVALEVVLPQGIVFLLRIHYEKEIQLLERAFDPSTPTYGTSLPNPPRRLVIPAIEKCKQRFIYLPNHHSSMSPIHHRYPSYSTATRLLKRWFTAHMLSMHIRIEVAELIMASIYLSPGSEGIPSSSTTAFLRSLRLLSEWNWKEEPLFVPSFHDTTRPRFDHSKREAGMKLFQDLRKKDPEISNGKPWVIITEDDVDGLRWTNGISRVVAGRIANLARGCREVVTGWEGGEAVDVKSLFTTPLEHYDILLHLDPTNINRYAESISPDSSLWEKKTFRNLVGEGDQEDNKAGYDVIGSFVKDLQQLYNDTFLVFYDIHGGTVIGLLWNPAKSQPRNMKAFLGYSTKPTEGESALVMVNQEAILGEIARLGKGLITRIERKN